MRSLFWGTVAILLSASAAEARTMDSVAYKLTSVVDQNGLKALHLCMRFRANHDGQAIVDLPDEWAGGARLYERLKDLHVAGAISVAAPAPARRTIHAKPDAPVSLCYRLDADPSVHTLPRRDTFAYPVITTDWFYIAGPVAIATVEGRDKAPIRFSWTLPKGWQGASNLEYPLPKDAETSAAQAVFMAGKDVRVARMKTARSDLRIAWRGRFETFSPESFNAAVGAILTAEQTFWGEAQPHFLVTLAPNAPGNAGDRSILGTGLGDAFAMAALPNTPLDDLKTILAHEYFHSWNPGRLGGFDEGEERDEFWFTEGFTDYYGRKLAYQSGIIDKAKFIDAWNEALHTYANSPYRSSPNSLIVEKFWTDDQAQKLPYQRGAMLAATWDADWRKQGKSLDGFMQVLRAQVKADTAAHVPHQKLRERLARAASAYGVSLGDRIDRNMIRGEPIDLPEDAFGPSFSVTHEDLPDFDLGYDPGKSAAAGTFAGVDPDGPAYKAGIRNGMKRVSVDGGMPGDSQVAITWHVLDLDGKPATFTFKPEGHAQIHRQTIIAK